MRPTILTLKMPPTQRLDLSPLVPHRLARLGPAEVAHLPLATTRVGVCVGDLFRLRLGAPDAIVFEGGSDRFDSVGQAMEGGELRVEGDVGADAGRRMRGGSLFIAGSAGPFAGSGMAGGRLEIAGRAGDFLGGPREGEIHGMAGGLLVLRGDAGARAGDRLRRGTIVIEGDAGEAPGSRMVAGTLIVLGKAGAHPGYLMRRGTMVLGQDAALSLTFQDSGVVDLAFARLFGRLLQPESRPTARLFAAPLRRFAGDMAVLGKGEIFMPA